MLTYNPEKFATLYKSDLGQRIWSFLIQPEIVARLETASDLGKPAVEGIEEQLLQEFGDEVLADRTKQMVGHIVRQIMEQRDWVLDQSDVKLQSVPFIKATRYRRPNWSTFHAFRNADDPRDVAITDRRQSPPLPGDTTWNYYVTFASPLKAAIAFGITDFRRLGEAVRAEGYVRLRVERMLRKA